MPGDRTLRVLDPDYPRELRELPSPPDPLHVRGALPTAPGVAIVGTRAASAEALAYAHHLAFELAREGLAIWSGGAVGIDAAAHQGAMDGGGRTVVVVGTGLGHTYPEEHAPLYDRIVRGGGALVSAFANEQRGAPWTFLHRNPVLVAATQATVLVQAPTKSGARSAAAAARRLGRALFVVPASPWDPRGGGALAELALGAKPLTGVTAILGALGRGKPPRHRVRELTDTSAPTRRVALPGDRPAARDASAPRSDRPEAAARVTATLSPTCRSVFQATGARALHVDDLCALTGLSAPLVHEALLTLTLQAVLVEGPGGCFRRITI